MLMVGLPLRGMANLGGRKERGWLSDLQGATWGIRKFSMIALQIFLFELHSRTD